MLNSTTAKQVLQHILAVACSEKPIDVSSYIREKGLAQVSNESEIELVVQGVLDKSPNQLAEFRSGKVKVRGFFFGEVMKALKGKGNPEIINKILDAKLSSPECL